MSVVNILRFVPVDELLSAAVGMIPPAHRGMVRVIAECAEGAKYVVPTTADGGDLDNVESLTNIPADLVRALLCAELVDAGGELLAAERIAEFRDAHPAEGTVEALARYVIERRELGEGEGDADEVRRLVAQVLGTTALLALCRLPDGMLSRLV